MTCRPAAVLTIVLALLWLALGYLNVARGAAHAGAGYRMWAFQHHCYSDVIALHGDRYALYGFLAGALVAAPLPLFLVLTAVSALDFHLAFEVRARSWEPAFRDGLWHPMNVARALLWLVLAAWIGRELWRAARPAPPNRQ